MSLSQEEVESDCIINCVSGNWSHRCLFYAVLTLTWVGWNEILFAFRIFGTSPYGVDWRKIKSITCIISHSLSGDRIRYPCIYKLKGVMSSCIFLDSVFRGKNKESGSQRQATVRFCRDNRVISSPSWISIQWKIKEEGEVNLLKECQEIGIMERGKKRHL